MGNTMPDIDYLKQLLELFDSSSASELRIEQEGVSIKLSKNAKGEGLSHPQIAYAAPQFLPQQAAPVALPQQSAAEPQPAAAPKAAEPEKQYHEIHSPIVGTFYRAPSPDSPNFVEVGSPVSPGTVLCIVEAMKLMNEIECDCFGKIAKIMVDNGKPVEYNQLLFLIEPD